MDRNTAMDLLERLPEGATEIIIRGRDAAQIFFCMPKGWKPDEGSKIEHAPAGLYYKDGYHRWRIK